MVFDWKNNREEALRNGIEEKQYFSVVEPTMKAQDGVIENHIFRNFDTPTFEYNVHIENCVFENCRSITFDDNVVKGCEFYNASLIHICSTNVSQNNIHEYSHNKIFWAMLSLMLRLYH